MIIFIIIVIVVLLIIYWWNCVRLPIGTAVMINGGIKTGKTLLLVEQAVKKHKIELVKWRFLRLFDKNREIPLIYSNIPIKSKYYSPLTVEQLKREERFNYKSIVLLSEISLVANSMNYKDEILNEELEMFIKLFGHETKGGHLIIDTQALADNHYAVKRSIDSTLWIERAINIKLLPFQILKIRRMVVCNENTTNVAQNDDKALDLYTHLIWKWHYKYYDRYGYSIFTDKLEHKEHHFKPKYFKQPNPPTFRHFKTLIIKEQEHEEVINSNHKHINIFSNWIKRNKKTRRR